MVIYEEYHIIGSRQNQWNVFYGLKLQQGRQDTCVFGQDLSTCYLLEYFRFPGYLCWD